MLSPASTLASSTAYQLSLLLHTVLTPPACIQVLSPGTIPTAHASFMSHARLVQKLHLVGSEDTTGFDASHTLETFQELTFPIPLLPNATEVYLASRDVPIPLLHYFCTAKLLTLSVEARWLGIDYLTDILDLYPNLRSLSLYETYNTSWPGSRIVPERLPHLHDAPVPTHPLHRLCLQAVPINDELLHGIASLKVKKTEAPLPPVQRQRAWFC